MFEKMHKTQRFWYRFEKIRKHTAGFPASPVAAAQHFARGKKYQICGIKSNLRRRHRGMSRYNDPGVKQGRSTLRTRCAGPEGASPKAVRGRGAC